MKKLVLSSLFWSVIFGILFIFMGGLIGQVRSAAWQSGLYGIYLSAFIGIVGQSHKRNGHAPLTSVGYWVGMLTTVGTGALLVTAADAALGLSSPIPKEISFGWFMAGVVGASLASAFIFWATRSAPAPQEAEKRA